MNNQRIYLFLIIVLFFASGIFAINGFNKNKINLGLDLVGGASLTLEADFTKYIDDLNQELITDLKQELRIDKISKNQNNIEIFSGKDRLEALKSDKTVEKITNSHGFYQIKYDTDKILITFKDQYLKSLKGDVIHEAITNIQKRIDSMGNKEISIQSLGENRILLQAPGFDSPDDLKYAVGKTAKLTFHLIDDQMKSQDIEFLKDGNRNEYRIARKIELDGKNINHAYNSSDKNGQVTVNFTLDKTGTEKFAELTANNIGKRLAVVIDDEVVTAPFIKDRISAGSVEISGNFTFDSAKNLASSLRAGALPVKLNVIEEKVVGASLGVLLISAGKKSIFISFAIVFAFMIIVYGALGIIAGLAILMNLFIVISIMIITKSTLSLAGIAGLVLTVGMVVDSNVLIFERIKEELKQNKKAFVSAINVGFERAISTIIDSNVTTVIASGLLLWFGDSNIKGFAITLTFGILISFFSAVSFSKILIQNFQSKILSYSFKMKR